jgi:hypothetical protein
MENGDSYSLPRNWVKAKTLGVLFAQIAVPVVVGFLGVVYANAVTERDIGVRYVELAIGILSTEPKSDNIALRIWAADLLSHYSAVALSDRARRELEGKRLDLASEESDHAHRELVKAIKKARERERGETRKP